MFQSCFIQISLQSISIFYNKMEETPLKNLQKIVGQFMLRVNYISDAQGEQQPASQCLIIYIENKSQQYCMEESFTQENLPSIALTIFGDIQTLFEHIAEYYEDVQRVRILQEGLLICNINKIKSKELRQQVMLPMIKVAMIKQLKGFSKIEKFQNPQMKAQMFQIISQNCQLKQNCSRLQEEVKDLRRISQQQQNRLTQLGSIVYSENKFSQLDQKYNKAVKELKAEQKNLIDSIEELKIELSRQKQQKQQLRENFRELLISIKSKDKFPSANLKGDVLGEKVNITIDEDNQNLSNFNIDRNQIERRGLNDEMRFQILGNQIFGKMNRSYYEVKIVKLAGGNFLVGFVSSSRRGSRQSHNAQECVCLQATGKVFDMGKKVPAITRLQQGQTVKVLLDLQTSMVRWYVGLTQICSVQIPDYFVNSKLVPYIQLNQKGDKIVLNG